jgi:predicted RNA-binding protein with PUA-like domain
VARSSWLFKTDPESYSVDDFERADARTTTWDGIRNTEARNLLRDRVQVGDRGFLYHSGGEPAVVAIVEVTAAARPDPTAFDRRDEHYDPKSDPAKPTWFMVDLRLVERMPRPVSLAEIKGDRRLATMALVTRGRLSVTPVTEAEWTRIVELARGRPAATSHATRRSSGATGAARADRKRAPRVGAKTKAKARARGKVTVKTKAAARGGGRA